MTLKLPPGAYNIVVAGINNDIPPGLFLTDNGEGKQLTVENATDKANQEWYIKPTDNAGHWTITPNLDSPAYVSEDVPKNPDQVFLLKNVQRWGFSPISDNGHLYEVAPFDRIVGVDRLLGVDENNEKVIIRKFPIRPLQPDSIRPAWELVPLGKD
ncbi:hypothetical protein BYT27DRAFT_7188420 [Phlegmacium glaucopus]|nr:hypothetical protein BYT27DRAFT_7188420 [Phlegmacium glaucopus]